MPEQSFLRRGGQPQGAARRASMRQAQPRQWPARLLRELKHPVAALLVLAAGVAVFSTAAALLGSRDGSASFRIAHEAARDDGRVHPLPLAFPSLDRTLAAQGGAYQGGANQSGADLAAVLDRLKAGPFGVALTPRPGNAAGGPPVLEAAVLVDVDQPPLRLDIMGLTPAGHVGAAAGRPALGAGAP